MNIEIVMYSEISVKGTVRVISSDPPCKDGNVRFTTVPLKPLSDPKMWKILSFFQTWKVFISPLLLISKKCEGHFNRNPQNKNK